MSAIAQPKDKTPTFETGSLLETKRTRVETFAPRGSPIYLPTGIEESEKFEDKYSNKNIIAISNVIADKQL